MTTAAHIAVSIDKIAAFCQRNHIHKLSLFGSVLRDDFSQDSDVDVLIEFDKGCAPGLIGLAGMELDLSPLLSGRKVEINTPSFLSPYFRDKVLATAELIYERT